MYTTPESQSLVDVCSRYLRVPDTEILFPDDHTQALSMALAPGDVYFMPRIGDEQIAIRHRGMSGQVAGSLGLLPSFKTRYRQLIPEQNVEASPLVADVRRTMPHLDPDAQDYVTSIVASSFVSLLARNQELRNSMRTTAGTLRADIDAASRSRELVASRLAHIPIPVHNPSRVLEWGAGIRTGLQRIEELRNRMWSEAILLHGKPFSSRVTIGVADRCGLRGMYCVEEDSLAALEGLAVAPEYAGSFELAIVDNDLPQMDDAEQQGAIENIHNLLVPKGLFVLRGLQTAPDGAASVSALAEKITKGFSLIGKYAVAVTRMDGISRPGQLHIFAKA